MLHTDNATSPYSRTPAPNPRPARVKTRVTHSGVYMCFSPSGNSYALMPNSLLSRVSKLNEERRRVSMTGTLNKEAAAL